MIYLFESKLPETKSVYFGLRSIYGIGKKRSFLICKKIGLSLNLKIKDLSSTQINQISKVIESSGYILANDLRRLVLLSKQRLISIKSYRGLRRKKGFPVRGQRTHTNARTAKKIR
uniref:Ribosomal protein S13 n=1 Tax=Navicula ramosissima TaxID=265559 RepID=A0A343A6X2_9STRA|nr:ribosomal protein S13 [Navicula ramosissima]AOY40410.1 ribosomal protein S13 [Navicula ramosissima]